MTFVAIELAGFAPRITFLYWSLASARAFSRAAWIRWQSEVEHLDQLVDQRPLELVIVIDLVAHVLAVLQHAIGRGPTLALLYQETISGQLEDVGEQRAFGHPTRLDLDGDQLVLDPEHHVGQATEAVGGRFHYGFPRFGRGAHVHHMARGDASLGPGPDGPLRVLCRHVKEHGGCQEPYQAQGDGGIEDSRTVQVDR